MSATPLLKFLIVDDKVIVSDTLIAMVEHCGHLAEGANDGESGKTNLLNKEYDAAFVHIRMPGIDGLTLLKWTKEVRLGLPIIIMTGHGEREVRDEAIKHGAFAFLDKPFSITLTTQEETADGY